MSEHEDAQLVIIGGGPAALTAALYAARAYLAPICFEGYDTGGQVSRASRIDNYPGVPEVSGDALTTQMREQAISAGARLITDVALSVDPHDGGGFTVRTSGLTIATRAVIIATGASARQLGVPGEEEWLGQGVAFCAICDGAFFAGQRVTVIGGGDAAIGEAMVMRKVASEVTLIHRREEFRASTASQAALAASDIKVLTPYLTEEIVGADGSGVNAVKLRDLNTGETLYHPTDGVFVSIGHDPASELFKGWIDTDEHGYVLTRPGSTATSVPGAFAAGDVVDHRYRQAVTAAASGCQAAVDAERWLVADGDPSRERPVASVLAH